MNPQILKIVAILSIFSIFVLIVLRPPHRCLVVEDIILYTKKCKEAGMGVTSFAHCLDCCIELLQCDTLGEMGNIKPMKNDKI